MVAGGGCPRFVPIEKSRGKKKKDSNEPESKRPAESSGIDIQLVSIRDILSRDRHKTDDLEENEK